MDTHYGQNSQHKHMNEILRHRRYCMKKKAPQYEFFDYLEHTGHGEYINLPYQPNNRTRLKFRYSVPTITEECILFGARNRIRTTSFYWYQNTNLGGSIFSRTGGGLHNFGNSFLYDWYEVVANTPTEWVRKRQGTSAADQTRSWDGTEFTVPFNLYLFCINHNDAPVGSGSHDSKVNLVAGVKISAIELYEDTELLMDLKPARRNDGRTGYYDALNDAFYFSENEYDFNVGMYADEYDYYDYLENTSQGQYINTTIKPDQDTDIELDYFSILSYAGSQVHIFGGQNAWVNGSYRVVFYSSRLGAVFGALQLNTGFGSSSFGHAMTFSKQGSAITAADVDTGITYSGSIPSGATYASNYDLALFGCLDRDGAWTNQGIVRIGAGRLKQNGILVRNFRPAVRRADGKTGMFDGVDSILYQSYTGVAFNYGNLN